MATKDLTHGKPLNVILSFMAPVFLGNLFQMLYNVADAMIVGKTIGINALGAIGATSSLIFLVFSFIYASTQGFSVVLAQCFGKKDYKCTKKSFAASLILSLIMSLILSLLFLPFIYPILNFLNTPSDIIDMSASYLFIMFGGITVTVFYNTTANTLRALGDSRTPLYFLALAAILNVFLDLYFILKCNMGVVGAGLATVLSQEIAVILCFVFMFWKFPILRLGLEDWQIPKDFLLEHIRIGIPMGFQISILTFGKIILQYVLNSMGSDAVSAFTTGMRIDQIIYQIYLALGITVANFTAQNYGAKKYSRIKQGTKISIQMVLWISIVSFLILFFFSRPIVMTFMKNPTESIITMALHYLWAVSVFLVFLGILLVYRNVLQGIGSVTAPVISGVVELFVRSLSAIGLGYYIGYRGICFATPLAWLFGAVVLFLGYRISLAKNFRKRKKKLL